MEEGVRLWESDITYLGTSIFLPIDGSSHVVEDKVVIHGISASLSASQDFSRNAPIQMRTKEDNLAEKLVSAPNRVKFWFQNKRNQTKVQNDRVDNNALRSENDRMRHEYHAFSAVMKNVICPTCDACPFVGEEARKLNVQKLRMENSLMKEMQEGLSNEITSQV